MNVFSITSYFVRALIFLCLIYWSSTHAKNVKNLRDQSDTSILTNNQHEELNIRGGKFSNNAIATEVPVHKRQKRCLLTMLALGSVASLTDWFWHSISVEPTQPKLPQRPQSVMPKLPPRPQPVPPKLPPRPQPVPPKLPPRPKPTTRRTTTTTRRSTIKVAQRGVQSCVTKWGSCVRGGKPDYKIEEATYIMHVEVKVVMNVWVLEFRHPKTKEKIQVPRDIPDEYIIFETQQVFIIFIDLRGRTFLIYKRKLRPDELRSVESSKVGDWFVTIPNTNIFNIMNYLIFLSNTNDNVGSLVIKNEPKYDPSKAVFIMKVKKKQVNGIWVVEFLHPPTSKLVQLPIDIGDDYIIEKTLQVFKIFVDFSGTTFLIYVGVYKPEKDATKPGVPSINNFPPCNIEKAIRIHDVVQKVDNGILMIEFIHPDTQEIIQVPFHVGDVYVDQSTKKAYLIFVDIRGKTLLIFKGLARTDIQFFQNKIGSVVEDNKRKFNLKNATYIDNSVQKLGLNGIPVLEWIHPFTNYIVQIPVDVGQVHIEEKTARVYVIYVDIQGRTFLILKGFDKKNQLIPDVDLVGRLVIKGVPKYDLPKAIFVMDTELKVLPDGCKVLVFQHPITKQMAQIPPNIGDEHVDKQTQRVFIIFVDVKGRTLLIFKGWREDKDERGDIDPLQIGFLVDKGLPKFNVETAIVIRETVRKIAADGSIVIEFRHPVIQRNIQIPRDKGDNFVMKKTGEVFKIFVDFFQRTFLILKSPGDAGKDNELKGKNGGVTVVIRGVPKYDIGRAIIIEKTEQMLDKYGQIVIVFEHPISKQRISLPYNKGDVYVNPRNHRVYKIAVDSEGETLLVYMRNERDKKEVWVTVVKAGFPAFNLAKAIFVTDALIKIKRQGMFVKEFVEFRHPISRIIIRISTAGADRYVKPGTQEVYIILVDNRGRTLLIFEGMKGDLEWQKDPDVKMIELHQNKKIKAAGNESDSDDIGRYPSYDFSRPIIIWEAKKRRGFDGAWQIVFRHPDSGKIISVPFDGGKQHRDVKTGKVFIVYVDRRKQTFLVLKPDGKSPGTGSSDQIDGSSESQDNRSPNHDSYNENFNENVNDNINENVNVNINRITNRNLIDDDDDDF